MSILEFNKQVTLFSESLYSFAYNLTRDIEDSKDLIQETIFRALLNKDKFMENTNLKAWMYTIMKNIFINNYRKDSRRKTTTDETVNQFYINTLANTGKNEGETNSVYNEIMAAVQRIDSEIRIPFLMHYQGFKYQEIADKLDIPLGTVKSRIFFARKELQRSVSKY